MLQSIFLITVCIFGIVALENRSFAGGKFQNPFKDNHSRHPRLAWGYSNRTNLTAAPFVVAVVLVEDGENSTRTYSLKCSGSIIHKEWVLTVTACLTDETNSTVGVIAGASDASGFYESSENGTVQFRKPRRFIFHPSTWTNEELQPIRAALIQVEQPFVFNTGIGRAVLRNEEWRKNKLTWEVSYFGMEICTVHGWGFLARLSETHQEPDLRNAKVLARYGRSACPCLGKIDERLFICAGGFGVPGGTCDGDVGGPLICRGSLAGVTVLRYKSDCSGFDEDPLSLPSCEDTRAVSSFIYICPVLKFINKHVPETTKASAICKSPGSVDISIELLILAIATTIARPIMSFD
ncbi:protease [Nesidiocoris tenuis]|uniref:Protease n=1 Tax=Nesidiocoris tenuis TaxID=355587 RepID=A0ABN7B4B6_9HEMI|nr:protease [Nesidiocoris tenuis]